MKHFVLTLVFLFFMSVTAFGAEAPVPQHKEDDILLTFHDDKGEIIRINWNGTVRYKGELPYVSVKFWELLIKVVPQLCQRNMIVSSPKPFERITIKTMKGDIVLNKDQVKNTMSVVHLNTLGEPAAKFWKAVESAFPESCK